MKDHRTPLRHCSPAEAANRTAKAARLLGFLQDHGGIDGRDVATMRQLDAGHWARIAELAGERPPSPATVAVVITLAEAAAAPAPVDVFAGLGAA